MFIYNYCSELRHNDGRLFPFLINDCLYILFLEKNRLLLCLKPNKMLIQKYITQLHYLFHTFIFTSLNNSSCEPYILFHIAIPNKLPISFFRNQNLIYVIEIFDV